jgi:hypothetical protein
VVDGTPMGYGLAPRAPARRLLTRRNLIASTGLAAAAVSVIQQEYVAELKAQAANAIATSAVVPNWIDRLGPFGIHP